MPSAPEAVAVEHTAPPGRYVVLYDGLCKFCAIGGERLRKLARSGAIELVNFQEPGVLERFPGVPLEACLRQMYLVTPTGRVYGGFEAIVQALATRPVLGLPAHVYYVPGLRRAFDRLYALIAAHRYRIMGRAAAEECESGTCAVHFRPR
jgi:predicted DCC family thiol-disulfide oxidoreductase YuxK